MNRTTWILCSLIVAGNALAAAPATPRLPNGKPDLNGTWENGGGIEFLKPQTLPDGSVCVSNCPPPPGAAAPGPRVVVPPDVPKYKPQFAAKVAELNKNQQKTD